MVRAIRLKAIVKAIFWMAFFFPKRNDVANADIPRHLNNRRVRRINQTHRLLAQMPMGGNIQQVKQVLKHPKMSAARDAAEMDIQPNRCSLSARDCGLHYRWFSVKEVLDSRMWIAGLTSGMQALFLS